MPQLQQTPQQTPQQTLQQDTHQDSSSPSQGAGPGLGPDLQAQAGNAATQEAMLRQQLEQRARGLARDLGGQATAHKSTLWGIAVRAQEALSTAEPEAFRAAREEADAALQSLLADIEQTSLFLDVEIGSYEEQGVDAGVLERIRDEALPAMVPTAVSDGVFGEPWVIWRYQGNSTITMHGYAGGLGYPPPTKDPVKDVDRWRKYLLVQEDRFYDILVEGRQTYEWAVTLDEEPDGGWEIMRALKDSPATNEDGRYREYCDAVTKDLRPAWADYLNRSDRVWLSQQITAEDKEGHIDWEEMDDTDMDEVEWEGEIDFDKLDRGVHTIGSELSSTWVDDDVMMDALNKADSEATREYMLRRMRAKGDYSDMVHEFDGEEVGEFQKYRSRAGMYADDSIGSASGPSWVDSVEEAGRLAPGAIVATGAGMTYGIPILGDIIEKEYGEDINAGIGQMYKEMGADPKAAALSQSIATGAGKVATAIGTAAAGGGSTKILSGASKLGTAGKIGTATVFGADMANNAWQVATGEKVTGDEISGLERGAAGLGVLGGAADMVGTFAKSTGTAAYMALATTDDAAEVGADASRVAGDVSGAVDDVAEVGADMSRVAGDVSGASDDVAEVSADVSRVAGDVSGASDDVAEVGADVSRAADDAPSLEELTKHAEANRALQASKQASSAKKAASVDKVPVDPEEAEGLISAEWMAEQRAAVPSPDVLRSTMAAAEKAERYSGVASTAAGYGGNALKIKDAHNKYDENTEEGKEDANMVEQHLGLLATFLGGRAAD